MVLGLMNSLNISSVLFIMECKAFQLLVVQIDGSEVMYKKWFMVYHKCKQHLIVLFKEIILISWSINITTKECHYSDNLNITNESSIYAVKHKKSLIENLKRVTLSLVYSNFLRLSFLVVEVKHQAVNWSKS
jgi:hypothetical protein